MTSFTALLDANILYLALMRDIFLQLAVDGLVRAKWTADIHRESINALHRNEPHRDRPTLERTRDRMGQATRDCLVTKYETLIPALDLPDPDDRHALAAAIVGRCDVIVTFDLGDFPERSVAPYGIEVLHPDTFLSNHLDLMPGTFCTSVRMMRARQVTPHISVQDHLAILHCTNYVEQWLFNLATIPHYWRA